MNPRILRTLLVTLFLAVQLSTVLIVVLDAQQHTSEQFKQNAQVTLDRLADTVSDQTRLFLTPAESAIHVGHQLIGDGVLDTTVDLELEQFFLAQLRSNHSLNGFYLGRNDGSLAYVARQGDGVISRFITIDEQGRNLSLKTHNLVLDTRNDPLPGMEGFDPRNRPWFEKAQQQDGLVWTGAYGFFHSRLPGITAAIKVHGKNGADAGVIGVDIDIGELSSFLSGVPNAHTGTAIIVDERRNAVAFSDLDRLTSNTESQQMPSVDQVAGIPLRKLYETIAVADAVAARPSANVQRIEVDGQIHLGITRTLTLSEGKVNWMLMVQAPENEFSDGLSMRFNTELVKLIGAIVLPALIAMIALLKLTAPVYRMHEDATTDRLTGALNRAEFDRRLEGMMNSRREDEPNKQLVLVALDLDGFKQINDNFGHGTGDTVLQEFVERLQSRTRQGDLIGRIGGDEFMLALQLEPSVDVMTTIGQIRLSVISRPIRTVTGKHHFGVTAGVACYTPDESLVNLQSRADAALVSGKAQGKNRCYLASHRTTPLLPVDISIRRHPSKKQSRKLRKTV